jgi:hypothetical protein
MIYDMVKDLEAGWGLGWDSMFATKLFIAVFYCLDYLHLYKDLFGDRPGGIIVVFVDIVLDAIIPILFCLMACAISHEERARALVFLLLLSVLMFLYVPPRAFFTVGYFLSKAVLILVSAFMYVSYKYSFVEDRYVPWFFFACMVGYGLHVFCISERTKKQVLIDADRRTSGANQTMF